jgi:ferredoxin
MSNKPELIKISQTEYGCSGCSFKIDRNMDRVQPVTEAERQRSRKREFAEHIRLCHSAEEVNTVTESPKTKTREDVNQAAVRTIREATEK